MIWYVCDGCGKRMDRKALRYTVNIEVRAAYEQLEIGLSDLVRDHRQEILRLVEAMRHEKAEDLEAQVYKRLALDLCPACQRNFTAQPLRFHPEGGAAEGPVDIDAFLRSLGYGAGPEHDVPEPDAS